MQPHRNLALEHKSREPLELVEEVFNPEGNFEDLVHIENSLPDAHLGAVRCL